MSYRRVISLVKFTSSDIIEIISACEKEPRVDTVLRLTKDYNCKFGDILRVVGRSGRTDLAGRLRAENKRSVIEANTRHREQRRDEGGKEDEDTGQFYKQTTKVESARRGKPFTLKIQLTPEHRSIIRSKLDAINKEIRKSIVSEAKRRTNEIPYQDIRPDDLSARETMLAVGEEKRINVNRLHFGKIKKYTPLILDNQCFKLTEEGLYINSVGKFYPVIVGEEKTSKELEKYYRRRDTLIQIGYPKKDEEFVYANIFIQQSYPQEYNPDFIIKIIGLPIDLRYEIHFLDLEGNDMLEPYIINVKSWVEEGRNLQKQASIKKIKALENEDYDEHDKLLRKIDEEHSTRLENFLKSKLRYCLSNGVFSKIEDKNLGKPIFDIPFMNFPQAKSPDKDWNFAQNKKLYVSKFKEILTGMAWRHGVEVISLSEEDTETYRDFAELKSYLITVLEHERETREKKENQTEIRQQMATFGKQFKSKHKRKATKEEKEEYKKSIIVSEAETEGDLRPSHVDVKEGPSALTSM